MAAPLRVTRRPKGSSAPRKSLTAASQPITDPQKQLKTTLGADRLNWQHEAWDHSEQVGELSYYVSWRSNSCSRVRLIASDIDEETGLPTGGLETDEKTGKIIGAEAQRVAEWVKAIAGGPLGQSAMIARAVQCLTVPGEVWLAVLVETDVITGQKADKWYVVTRDEIKNKGADDCEIELPTGKLHKFNASSDSLVRVWFPRPRRAREATSPVRACLDSLREIQRTSKKIKNAAKSRLMNNGVLFLPAEMSLPAAQAPIAADQAAIPGAPPPVIQGVPAADQLADLLFKTSVAAMEDEDSQSGYIPLMATVPGDHLEKVQHLKFGNDITDVEIKTRTDAITRLAMGLDVSPERLLGMSSGNHWSAWQIGDEDVNLHIKPVMDLLCQAIYTDLLSIMLKRENIDPAKYTLTYDASQLTADPDLTDEAVKAHELGALTHAALRRLLNVGEDSGYDLSTLEGCQEFARDAVTNDPTLITTYLPLLALDIPELGDMDFPAPAALPPGQQDPNAQDPSGADQQQEPNTEDNNNADDSASAAIGSPIFTSRAEYILAERLLVTRAMDLAGKRRVKTNDHTQRARLNGKPAHEWHRYLPPVREDEIPRLIAGWDVGLEDETIAMLGVDTDSLRDAVRRAVRRELTREVIDVEVSV